MAPASKGRALRLEVDETDRRVWFRLYSHDAVEVRNELDPGAIVYIRARIREYARKGGFLEELGNACSMRPLDDKFSLEVPSLELFYICQEPRDAWDDETVEALAMTPAERLRSVGLFGTVHMALDRLRAGLDSRGSGIEEYHEAEEMLCQLLGNPVWTRPE